MKYIVSVVVLTVFWASANAQENLGLVNGNYSGVNGLAMNPAYMSDSKLYLDINILSVDGMYQMAKDKNAYGNFRLNLPSFAMNVGSHGFGFTTALRTAVSYRKITANEGRYQQFYVAGAAWGEVGLNYSKIYRRVEKNVWSVGGTLKGLFGAGGFYYAATSLGYTSSQNFTDNMSIMGMGGDGGLGFGKGVGIDFGIFYQKKIKKESVAPFTKLCQQKYHQYRYRIGVSVIDLGYMRFKSNVNNSNFNHQIIDTNYVVQVDSLVVILPVDSLNNSDNSSLKKEKFSVYTPAAACFQLDIKVSDHWYFNGTFIKALNLSEQFIRRPTLIAITPRYEKRWFEAGFPVSASDMRYFRMGAYVRFWNFTVGTDNMFGSMGVGMHSGFDFYTSLKINFRKGRCGNAKENGGKGGILEPFRQLFK